MSDIKTALQEFVATYNDPKVAKDIDKTLSYFPELKGFDKNTLAEYIATYEDPKVKGDWEKVNSYFPEFFADNKTQKTTAPKTTAPEQNAGGFAIPMMFGNEKTIAPDPNTGIFTPEIAAGLRGEVNPNPQPTPEPTTKQWLGDLFEGMGGVASTLIGNTIDLGDRLKPENLAREIVMRSGAGKEGFKAAEEMRRSKATADKIIADKLIGTGKQLTDKSHDYYGTVTDENGQTRPKDFTDLWSEGNYSGAFGNILLEGGKSLPTSVMAFNPVGLGVIGAGSFNEKYNDVSANKDINMAQAVLNATGTASFELLSERLGALIDAKILKRIAKTAGAGKAKETAKAVIYEYLKAQPKEILTEGVEEAASQLAENITDIATGVKQPATMKDSFKMLFDNVLESGVYGMGGGAFGGATMGGSVAAGTMLTQPIKAKKQAETTFNDADRRLTAMLSRNGFTAEEVQDIKNSMLQATPENRNSVVVAIAQAIPEAITRKDGKVVFNPEISDVFTDFYIGSDKLQSVNKAYNETMEAERAETIRLEKENAAQELQRLAGPDGMIRTVKLKDGTTVQVRGESMVFDENGMFDMNNSSTMLYYTDEAGQPKMMKPYLIESLVEEKPIEQAAMEADQLIDQEISDKEIDEFLPLQPEIYQVEQGTIQVQYNPETMEIEAVLVDENSGTPISDPYAIDKTTYSQMSGKQMPEAIKTTENEPVNEGSAPVVSGDMTENAPVTSETAPVQPQYPVNKKGEVDVDAMTVAQTYQYMVDNYGQQEAVEALQLQEKNTQAAIQANIKATDKFKNGQYAEVKKATTIQEQLKIREKHKATAQKLTDERAVLDAQLAEIRALMPQVEQAPAQPEVKPVTRSNVRPEVQFRREQEAKAAEQVQTQPETEPLSESEKRIQTKKEFDKISGVNTTLVGSTSRGEATENSDIDIVLEGMPIQGKKELNSEEREENSNYAYDTLVHLAENGTITEFELLPNGFGLSFKFNGYMFQVVPNPSATPRGKRKKDIEQPVIEVTPEAEQQPVIEVRAKEKNKNIINAWQRRLNNLGDAMTVEDVVLRRIAGGAKFVWTANAPLKGMADELGFANKPGEHELRKKMIDNENGMTPQEFAHVIFESGDLDFMPGVEYQDVYNAVLDTLLSVNSATDAMKTAERLRDSREFSMNEQAEWDSMTEAEMQYLEEIPDDILESYLGITNFTPEQLDIIQNLQNEYYGTDTTTTETSAVDSTPGIESETGTGQRSEQQPLTPKGEQESASVVSPRKKEMQADTDGTGVVGKTTTAGATSLQAQLDTQTIDAEIAAQDHNNNPTEKQKETGIYNKARISLQGHNITLETLKGKQRSGTDSNGKTWSITMNNHYGELDGTTGYDGDAIDVFVGPNPKQGQIFVIDQISNDGTFDESKVMLGFDTSEQAKAAYMRNYEAGWQGFGSITPAGDKFKAWLYDGKKQRKPFAEYKETPEAVEVADQSVDTNEMIDKPAEATSTPKYKNGDTVTYKGKQYTVNGIYAGNKEVDLEDEKGNLMHEEVPVSELNQSEQPAEKQSSGNKLPEQAEQQPKQVDVAGVFNSLNKKGEAKLSENIIPDKVSAAQAEADAALQDFLDAFNDLNSDNLGIVDNTAEKQAKMLVAGTKMVGAYTKLGVYKFADLVSKLAEKGIQITEDLLSAIKKAYGAFAAENDIDELDDMKTVRQFTINDIQQNKNEDLTPKKNNSERNDVSLNNQKSKDNGSNKPNSRTANRKPESNRGGLSLFDEVDGQRTSTENIAGNSKGEQLQSGNSSSESGIRPQYDVNKTYTNEEISEIVSSVTAIKDGKIEITGEVTEDIKTIASRYVSGGIAKKGRGILDEYYTDSKIVDAVTRIVTKLLPSNTVKRALEPSVGTGNFIQSIPTGAEIVGFEINETTARIAKIFNPNVEVNLRSFETEFIDDSGKKKPITSKYNLVVGNPPYGEHRGMYKGLGEESKISKYEDYFVKRSLDVLEEGGVLAMVLPSSWMDRHKLETGYIIEVAYRLPSGAFEATQVGTDIVVLRKRTTNISFNPHNYFQNNPENVLGEVKERSNRFGKMEQYVAGDIDAALAKIEQNEARKVANDLQVEATSDNVNDIAESIEETGSPEKTKKVVKASKQTKTATVTTGKVEIKKGTLKYNFNKGDEVVPASAQFPNEFSPEQEAAFKDCNYSGVIPKSKYEQHKQFVNFYNFDWVHDFYYAEGNIYEKLEQLERDKPNMEQAQYDKQKQMLRSVLPEIKTLDKVSISPNTEFVKNLSISTDKSNSGTMSLKDLFEDFVRKLPRESFGNSSSWEVIDYVENRQVYGTDKERNALVRERRKAAANDLFKKFLTDEVSAAERSQIEYAFNREYNAMYRPDYSKVPMFSSINKNFKGRPLQLTVVQRAGIGRSTVKGVGILAHEVGFGKTLSGILAVHEAMTRNTAKKPLIIVPNDGILKQWVETIYEVLPQSTVNVLGNLGVDYDLTDFTVNDNEITIVTYEGFKAMGFKDETYDKLAQDFNYITDDLKAHKSERDRQKEKAKQDETKGKMRKKVAYDFEDFGFDFMTFDEVHNANHIVGKVKLDKKVSSDFRTQNQRTSDLGIKTWLASQYIQENNNGRNVLLLSATPFTNKPLEYYSILSLVGNSTLKRMGFYQVDQFFETFMEADNDIEIKADGTPAQKTNVRRFKNNGLFNQLLSEFIDIKGEDDNPDLVRPERHNREYKIPQNDLTAETISNIQDLFINNEDVLKGITHSRLVAFSPYASSYSYATPKNYKQFVENSPKIHTALKLIAQNKKDNSGAGQLMYSEIGVEFFPMIQEYLIKEVGYNANEVRIISGATSLTERANIQNGFNKGEIKVIIGSPAIKEGINLQENTTDMYILSLPYNFTQLRQVEGRSWRQGNKWSNIRINYMLTDNSVDVFLLQRLQIKQGLYNESMKNGADTVDVSDIDTSELKTALITDPTTRANIELMIERGRLEAEKTRITSDLAFIHRKFERYNDLKKKINTEIASLQQREKWAETDPWWARNLEGARRQVETLKNEIENEKQRLIEKGVNVDDIVSQETNATNQIAEINKKIEALKDRLNELIVKYTAENIAKAKVEGDVVSRYIKERAQENKGDFYTKIIVDDNTVNAPQSEYQRPLPATIEVDGIQRPTTNSNGKPIHSTEEGIRNFWRWFGDSKVVDNEGRPLVVNHGSRDEFTTFDKQFSGKSNSLASVGFWFSDVENFGERWAENSWGGNSNVPVVYNTYLKLENPFIYESSDYSKELDSIDAEIYELKREKQKLENSIYIWDYNAIEAMNIAKTTGFKDKEIEDYYRNRSDESSKAIDNGFKLRELSDKINKLQSEYYDKLYTDSYQKFKTDVYKIAGMTSKDANIGGLGMAIRNKDKVVEEYVSGLKEKGYDGIIIKNTSFDKNAAGGIDNNQYVVFDNTQIKSATGNNGEFNVEDANILHEPTQTLLNFTPEETKDETEKAYGSEEKQQEAIDKTIAEAEKLQIKENAGLIANRRPEFNSPVLSKRTVLDSFKESGYVNFIGQRVNTHQDIADMWSIHRSPYIEKGHVIFLNDNNEIVGTIATTANHASQTRLAQPDEIIEHARKLGATSVYLLHNHPSGNAVHSSQDVRLTVGYNEVLSKAGIEIKGHVIVDHDKYTFIDATKISTDYDWKSITDRSDRLKTLENTPGIITLNKYGKPQTQLFTEREVVGRGQDAPERLFEIGKNLLSQPTYKAAIIYLQTTPELGFNIAAYDIIPEGATKKDIIRIANEGLKNNLGVQAVITHDGSFGERFWSGLNSRVVDVINTKIGSHFFDTVHHPLENETLWAHQIIGEYGARNLDAAEEATTRLDNLRVAKEMEVGKKSPFSAIKLANIKEDYDLSEDTESNFEYDLMEALGRKLTGGRYDYTRKGDVIIRVKGHTPNWDNFIEDVEENGAKAILNITVGDYNNTDYRRNKATKDNFESRYPDVKIIDITVEDGESISSVVDALKTDLEIANTKADKFTPAEIRLATGWERGADSKWRYEVPDGELKISTDEYNRFSKTLPLSEVIENEEVFKAYPELSKIPTTISIDNLAFRKGEYNPKNKTIRVVATNLDEVKSTLIHEIQHAIQEIEGFAQGGNVQQFEDEESKKYRLEEIQNQIDAYNNSNEGKQAKEERELLLDKLISKEITQLDFDNAIAEFPLKYPNYNTYSLLVADDTRIRKEKTPQQKYHTLAGEVEARNASARMNFTVDERRQRLLSETADVAPEDQIVLMDAVGVSESRQVQPLMQKPPRPEYPVFTNKDNALDRIKKLQAYNEANKQWVKDNHDFLPEGAFGNSFKDQFALLVQDKERYPLLFQREIERMMGWTDKTIPDTMDWYKQHEHLSSKNGHQIDQYNKELYSPFMVSLARVTAQTGSMSLASDYMIVSHAIERNQFNVDKRVNEFEKTEYDKLEKLLAERAWSIERSLTARERYYTKALKDDNVTQEKFDEIIAKNEKIRKAYPAKIQKTRQRRINGTQKTKGIVGRVTDYRTEIQETDYSGAYTILKEYGFEESRQGLQDFVADFESKYQVGDLWQRNKAANDFVLDKLYEGQIITADMRDELKTRWSKYVPLRGFDEIATADDLFGEAYSGNSNSGYNNPLKTMKGRKSRPEDPFKHILSMAETAILKANKNLVNQTLNNIANFIPENPYVFASKTWYIRETAESEWVEVAEKPEQRYFDEGNVRFDKNKLGFAVFKPYQEKEHDVVVYVNGNKKVITFTDPRVANGINGNSKTVERVRAIINAPGVKQWHKLNTFIKRSFTSYSPNFIIKNGMRDAEQVIYTLSINNPEMLAPFMQYFTPFESITTLKNGVNGKGTLSAIFRYLFLKPDMNVKADQYLQEFLEQGVPTGIGRLKDIQGYEKEFGKQFREAEKILRNEGRSEFNKWLRKWMLASPKRFEELIERLNSLVETNTRLAVYIAGRETGKSKLKAGSMAKNYSINFTKSGEIAPLLDLAFLFANPAIQSTKNYLQYAKAHPVKTGISFMSITIAGFALSALAALMAGDDDEGNNYYYMINETVRKTNVIFFFGSKKDDYIKIPVTQFLSVMYGWGVDIADLVNGKANYIDKIQRVPVDIIQNVSPVNIDLGFHKQQDGRYYVGGAIPQAIKPLYEAYIAGEDAFEMPVSGQNEYNEGIPEYRRSLKSTAKPFVKASEFLNKVSGGDKVQAGAININPDNIEHIVQGYTGTAGKFYIDTYKTAAYIYNQNFGDKTEEIKPSNIPIAGVFYGNVGKGTQRSYYSGLYYDMKQEYDKMKSDIREYRKVGEDAKAEKIENSNMYKSIRFIGEIEKEISELRKVRKNSENPIEVKQATEEQFELHKKAFRVNKSEEVDYYDTKAAYNELVNKVQNYRKSKVLGSKENPELEEAYARLYGSFGKMKSIHSYVSAIEKQIKENDKNADFVNMNAELTQEQKKEKVTELKQQNAELEAAAAEIMNIIINP